MPNSRALCEFPSGGKGAFQCCTTYVLLSALCNIFQRGKSEGQTHFTFPQRGEKAGSGPRPPPVCLPHQKCIQFALHTRLHTSPTQLEAHFWSLVSSVRGRKTSPLFMPLEVLYWVFMQCSTDPQILPWDFINLPTF